MIYGMTHDQDETAIQTVALVGKVGIGVRSSTPGRAPKKFDYFVVFKRSDKGDFVIDDELTKKYGKRREIKISLVHNDIDTAFQTSLKWIDRSSGSLMCKGNNKAAMRRMEDGSLREIRCDINSCPEFLSRLCKPYGFLYFNFYDDQKIGACYFYRTTSVQGIKQILSSLYSIKAETERILGKGNGIIAGLPLWLVVRPYRKKYLTEDGGFAYTKQLVANIELRKSDWRNEEEFEQFVMKLAMLPNAQPNVPDFVNEDDKVREDLVNEFLPEEKDPNETVLVGSVEVNERLFLDIRRLPEDLASDVMNRIATMSQEEYDKKEEIIKEYVKSLLEGSETQNNPQTKTKGD